ncbi:hypothetical protein GCM10009546_70030 [Actinomadura livida]|nr:hypothetical protein GCM10010208_01000 [Actinomadura livida]
MHVPTMSLREFDDAQRRMPPGLAERTQRLRACATRAAWCGCCGVARRLLRLCFAAVRHGDDAIAEMLLGEAGHYIGTGRHPATCPQMPPRPARRDGRAPAQGRVPGWTGLPGPLVAATDASWKRGTCGIGYVVSDGRWGMRGWTFGPQDPTGPHRVLNETADSLASIARRRATETFDSTARAEGLVEAFLHAWHRTGGIAA